MDLILLSAVAATIGCTPDAGAPVASCELGRYWADCGGDPNAEPVLGCDTATGQCRYFVGGLAAEGYAVTDCAGADICCHGGWPFAGWAPTGAIRAVASSDLALLRHAPIGPSSSRGVPVDFGLVVSEPLDRMTIECGEIGPIWPLPCGASFVRDVSVIDETVVVQFGDLETRSFMSFFVLEIWTNSDGQRRARLFMHAPGSPEADHDALACGPGSSEEMNIMDGALHLNADAVSNPDEIHGEFDGGSFALSF